ncbi:MAG: fructosamine kinase family protein [Phycisphaerales bacterium JB065]
MPTTHPIDDHRIERAIGEPARSVSPLSGGCVADVRLITTASGRQFVAKLATRSLDREAAMLKHLRDRSALPVPSVLLADPDLLIMEHIDHAGGSGWGTHLADLLAGLHTITADTNRFGFDSQTLIGPIPLSNDWSNHWPAFYRDHRLLPLIAEAARRDHLPAPLETRLRRFADRLDSELDHAPQPSLIHGDVWSGNVLASGPRVVGLIDPSIQYADPEFELAFIALFSTGGPEFFDRYREHNPIDRAFFQRRIYIYQLFPLLVHAALFGGGYVSQLDATLARVE